MQNISQFQSQFPLNAKKKMWKKLLGVAMPFFFLSLCASIFSTFLFMLIISTRKVGGFDLNPSSFMFDWKTFLSFFVLSVLFFNFVLFFIYGAYIRIYIKRYYYDSTDFLTIKKGVFTPFEIHVQYQKIQDVYVDQDILDRLLGIYDVHIASATVSSGIEAHIDGVDGVVAENLKNFILGKIQGSSTVLNNASNTISTAPTFVSPSISVTTNFSEEISSKTYPINYSWYLQSVISSFFSIGLLSFLFVFYFLYKDVQVQYLFVLWGVIFVVLFMGNMIKLILWKSQFYFAFLPQFIMQKTGVITTQEKHLPYKSVQDVTVRQGLIEKLFGLSTVVIENAVSSNVSTHGSRYGNLFVSNNNVLIPGQPIRSAQKIVEELKTVLAKRPNDSMGL